MEKSENKQPEAFTGLKFNNKTLICLQGDITESDTEAIVNAANNHLWMGAGVAGAIKRKGGQVIEDEAVKLGPIDVGEAAVTGAGALKAKHVIHAAVMGQDLRTSENHIKNATFNSLTKADELRLNSIAFPALGTGVGGFSTDMCAAIMMAEAFEFLKISNHLTAVYFILFDNKAYESFHQELDKKALKLDNLGEKYKKIYRSEEL
jgi:O-acetyl-ADP-ribose deacetylase (regulator of RNase III)